jgi:hypothetical protein
MPNPAFPVSFATESITQISAVRKRKKGYSRGLPRKRIAAQVHFEHARGLAHNWHCESVRMKECESDEVEYIEA